MNERPEHPAAPGKRAALALRRQELDRRREVADQRAYARRWMHPEAARPPDIDEKGAEDGT